MALHPKALAELERRGAAAMRVLLSDGSYTGAGPGASVPLYLADTPSPSRAEVEDWIRTKDDAERGAARALGNKTLRWTIVGAVAAIVAAALSLFVPLVLWLVDHWRSTP